MKWLHIIFLIDRCNRTWCHNGRLERDEVFRMLYQGGCGCLW